ncbi:hypothetical protein NEOKW01_0265 [Nematocida sp. AWRm80]|nr:hypothetical protein NEOKW01_0265 [Nematocida sp. AWRm80]
MFLKPLIRKNKLVLVLALAVIVEIQASSLFKTQSSKSQQENLSNLLIYNPDLLYKLDHLKDTTHTMNSLSREEIKTRITALLSQLLVLFPDKDVYSMILTFTSIQPNNTKESMSSEEEHLDMSIFSLIPNNTFIKHGLRNSPRFSGCSKESDKIMLPLDQLKHLYLGFMNIHMRSLADIITEVDENNAFLEMILEEDPKAKDVLDIILTHIWKCHKKGKFPKNTISASVSFIDSNNPDAIAQRKLLEKNNDILPPNQLAAYEKHINSTKDQLQLLSITESFQTSPSNANPLSENTIENTISVEDLSMTKETKNISESPTSKPTDSECTVFSKELVQEIHDNQVLFDALNSYFKDSYQTTPEIEKFISCIPIALDYEKDTIVDYLKPLLLYIATNYPKAFSNVVYKPEMENSSVAASDTGSEPKTAARVE